ncbi:MAG: WbqC family protein [Saprospiraceae bacterium]|nr:WbqC family protein [Lewinella sp.]
MSTIAIHQPNYYPWLGYFYKLYLADRMILLDDVAYSKGSYTARTLIRKLPGQACASYLSVPIKQSPLGTPVNKIGIDTSRDWTALHLARLHQVYRQSPYFNEFFPLIEWQLEMVAGYEYLADANIYLIREIADLLSCEAELMRSSSLPFFGKGTDYLIDLIQDQGGAVYVSGSGADKYQDKAAFKKAEIELRYTHTYRDLELYRYPQYQGSWLNGLSIIDALMNIGVAGIRRLFESFER